MIKQLIFTLFIILFYADNLNAQDCKNYYYLTNNAEVQMTIYDKNGKVSNLQTWKISNVTKDEAGFHSTVNSVMTDEKGREIAKGAGTYKCSGNKLMADVHMSMPQSPNKEVDVADAKLNDAYVEYPAVLTEGMLLPDVFFTMETNTSGVPSTTNFEMKNRKVEGKEKITSDAGSWDAYKITYDASIKIKMAGIGIPVLMKTAEWFAPGFGVVKTETFSKKGKKMGSTLLTGFKK